MNEDNFILEDVDRELTLNEKIEKIISEFEPKAVEYNSSDDGWSVKIQDQKSGMEFWVDVWVDTNYNDVETEWNQYIFDIQDDDDQLRSAIQNDNNVWDLASSEAINYLQENNEIKQNEKGEWEVVYKTPDGEFYEIYEEDFNDETGDIEGAGRIWNVETGMEREFVFTFDVQGSALYFNDFSTGDELDIRNENLINEIKSFADDYKSKIDNYNMFNENKELKTEVEVQKKFMLSYEDYMPVIYDPEDMSLEDAKQDYMENELRGVKSISADDIEVEYLDESKVNSFKNKEKKEEKKEENKYQGYTFIPVGNIKSNLNVYDYIRKNDTLNKKFDTDDGSYNYEEFYKIMPSIDIFKMPELDNILVMPGSNFLFEFTGDDDTIVPVGEVPSDEELRTEDEMGYIGTEEDKEVIDDLLDDDKDYMDISSKYGYSFNDYQLYNIATLYEKADNTIKTKIEDVLDNINYHSECSDISANASAFKSGLFESKKVEAKTLTWDEIFKNAEGTTFGQRALKVKDQARAEVEELMQKDGIDVDSLENVEDAIEEYVSKHNIKFLDNGCIANKKTEDVAINNGFNVTKYPEVQSLADNIANSIKDKEKITIDTVIDAIENWDGGDTSVFTILARVDKDLAAKIEADEDNRYEAENQFLGLVEDTLNDMGITVYDEYDESKKVESRPDKEAARNRYHSQLRKKLNLPSKLTTVDEIINYINNVDDPVGFLYIIDKIAVPDEANFDYKYKNDNPNAISALSYYMREIAEDLYDKYRFDGDRYVDDKEVAELMKPELVKALKEYTPEKSNEVMPKNESKKIEANTYGKTNADEINETIKDKEFMNNLGITAEDVIKQVEISKKDFDELVNYVNNYKGTFGELYKELQGWNLGDSNVEQDDDNLFDCYYKSLLVTINVDDGKLSVSPIDVYVYPNDITNVDSDELFHLDFDKPIEFDKILKEDATQCGAVDGGRVSIFGEKEKKEEAQDVEYDTDKALEDILNNVPVEVKHLGDYAYEYKGLYIELRPDTIFTDNTPPEMDFAVFEDEEDMNIDYELNIGTGYAAMTPYYRYWEAVMLYCDKYLEK